MFSIKRIGWIVAVLMLIMTTSGCCENYLSDSENVDEPTIPKEILDLIEKDKVVCASGIRVAIKGIEQSYNRMDELIDTFDWSGSSFSANIQMINALDKAQPYSLYLLQNGQPIPFSIEGHEYMSYHFVLEGGLEVDLETSPPIEIGSCRLDFLLCCDEATELFLTSYTVWLESGECKYPPIGELDVELREGLYGTCTGNTFHAWLWNADDLPESSDNVGDYERVFYDGDSFVLEAIAGEERPYRLTFYVNGEPTQLRIDDEISDYIDCYFKPDKMFRKNIELEKGEEIKEFFVVATPLGMEYLSEFCKPSVRTVFTTKVD